MNVGRNKDTVQHELGVAIGRAAIIHQNNTGRVTVSSLMFARIHIAHARKRFQKLKTKTKSHWCTTTEQGCKAQFQTQNVPKFSTRHPEAASHSLPRTR